MIHLYMTGKKIIPYLPELMNHLLQTIQSNVTVKAKELAISAIGATGDLHKYTQALFWSAHRRISAHFPRISDPSEISTNLLR